MFARRSDVVRLCEEELRTWKPGQQRHYWQAVEDLRVTHIAYEARQGRGNWSWCVAFVSWIYASAGAPLKHKWGSGLSYVPYLIDWAKAGGVWREADYEPDAGDLVLYTDGKKPVHVGIVVSPDESIEGNYSGRIERVSFRKQNSPVLGFIAALPWEDAPLEA